MKKNPDSAALMWAAESKLFHLRKAEEEHGLQEPIPLLPYRHPKWGSLEEYQDSYRNYNRQQSHWLAVKNRIAGQIRREKNKLSALKSALKQKENDAIAAKKRARRNPQKHS